MAYHLVDRGKDDLVGGAPRAGQPHAALRIADDDRNPSVQIEPLELVVDKKGDRVAGRRPHKRARALGAVDRPCGRTGQRSQPRSASPGDRWRQSRSGCRQGDTAKSRAPASNENALSGGGGTVRRMVDATGDGAGARTHTPKASPAAAPTSTAAATRGTTVPDSTAAVRRAAPSTASSAG